MHSDIVCPLTELNLRPLMRIWLHDWQSYLDVNVICDLVPAIVLDACRWTTSTSATEKLCSASWPYESASVEQSLVW
jgi:hypothetical protein